MSPYSLREPFTDYRGLQVGFTSPDGRFLEGEILAVDLARLLFEVRTDSGTEFVSTSGDNIVFLRAKEKSSIAMNPQS